MNLKTKLKRLKDNKIKTYLFESLHGMQGIRTIPIDRRIKPAIGMQILFTYTIIELRQNINEGNVLLGRL